MGGVVSDPSGAVVPNARVTITSPSNAGTRTTSTDSQGRWVVAGLPSGNFNARVEMPGFKTGVFNINYDASQASMYNFPLSLGSTTTTVEVSGMANQIQTESTSLPMMARNFTELKQLAPGAVGQNASANVVNLQKRVSGVLPIPIDVPRAGTSFSFVRSLVLDEETKVTFSYRSR